MKTDYRFIQALLKQPVDKTPIWIMRQAGRYLPEYREIRKTAGSFMQLCQTPELACEVTLQPLRRFDLDAAILFSDILTIPDAMGLGLHFIEDEGPKFKNPIRGASDIAKLGIPDPEQELQYVPNAVRLIKKELHGRLPLIGFAGSPWTLATYMIENGASKTFSKTKAMIYQDPKTLHQLLELLANAVSVYLNAQISAGVDVIMIFDTWGGVLTQDDYQHFSLQYMQHIIHALTPKVPSIIYTKGGGQWLELMAKTDCQVIGLDWSTDLALARRRVGDKVALQGNLDPCVLYANPEKIREHVALTLQQFGYGPGHIFNLGHGIYPDINPEHVKVLVDAVHELSGKYHQ